MANVKFPRKEFEKLLGEKITPKIEEKINLIGTPLESLTPEEIEIEIFPNRPDFLSLHGYIRGLKPFLGKKTNLKYNLNKPSKNYEVIVDSSVKKTSRPYTVCAIVSNLSLDDKKIKEIVDFQEKLHNTIGRNRKKLAIGIYPLEKIKLPIKFKARKPSEIKFTPLESKKEMTAQQILKKHPKGKEHAHLLKDSQLYPIFIDSEGKILSMPPVINSHETGKVNLNTKEVFIECSGYDQSSLEKTLNIIVTTFADMGGKIHQMTIKDKKKSLTPSLSYEKIKVSSEKIEKLLGISPKKPEIKKLLSKMGIEYSDNTATIPPWRTDILHEVDIIEDIAIAYGYDNFIPESMESSTIGKESKESKLKRKISETLAGLNLLEVSSYHLIKEAESKKIKLTNPIKLQDSKTDYKILRPNLLVSALRMFAENKNSDYPQNIFEIGPVFEKDQASETQVKEKTNLIIALSPGNFTEAKQHMEYLMRNLSIKFQLKESSQEGFIEGRTANIILDNKNIGCIGEVHPKTLNSWNLKMPLVIFELNLDEVMKRIS